MGWIVVALALTWLQGNSDRTYRVDAPLFKGATRYPLVIVLHGAYGSGEGMRSLARFYETPYRDSCIFVYPDAKVENWDEGCECNKPHRLRIDDVGFIGSLIRTLQEKYPVDSARIYAVGYSQGGLFAHHLACRMSDRLAAVSSVASSMNVPLTQSCATKNPIAVQIIHGFLDPVLPYQGSQNGPFSLLSATETANFWARQNGIAGSDERRYYLNTRLLTYGPADGAEVQLITPESEGHQWSFLDFDTRLVVLQFLLRHRRTY